MYIYKKGSGKVTYTQKSLDAESRLIFNKNIHSFGTFALILFLY